MHVVPVSIDNDINYLFTLEMELKKNTVKKVKTW